MQEFWMSLGVQVPLVAAFMWFALEMLKRFDAALARRDAALTGVAERLGELTTVIKVNDEKLEQINQKVERVDRKVGQMMVEQAVHTVKGAD